MPITMREARTLTTAAELSLLESSQPAALKALSPARLEAKVARARGLRDKYADVVKQQRGKGKPARTGAPDESLAARTRRKVELFAELLARFEARLAKLVARVQAPARRPTAPAAGRSRPDATPPVTETPHAVDALPPAKVKASRAPLVPKADIAKRAGQQRIQAHVSSRGRQRQARRDSR